MTDSEISKFSVNEIAQKIKQEVENLKSLEIKPSCQPIRNLQYINNIEDNNILQQRVQYSNFYNFAKKIGKYLQSKGFYGFVDFVRKNISIKKFNYVYLMSDFTKFNDEEFINNAYRLILNATADSEEKKYYLKNLREGALSKTEIIVLLHFSREGRKQNVIILGSKKRLVQAYIYKIPFIRYIAKLFFTLLTLPRLIKRINQFENYVFTELKKKVDENTLRQVQIDIDAKLSKKVDENTLRQVQIDIDAKLSKKVDENTLRQVQIDIDAKLSKKVDCAKLDIPTSLELTAMDYFADATSKFSYHIESFKEFDKDELYYSLFESTFYNHKVVLEKQAVYLQYIPNINSSDTPHLDIGCGRGEFLTLLVGKNYYCMGIDINSLEIEVLKKRNFNVKHIEMINFLESTQKTFSSISALQVIEHIDYRTLKRFIELAYTKINYGGVIILETINPHNKVAFNSFYMDETHKRPLPPEMVAFILQYYGFKNIKFIYTLPMPQEFRSKENDNMNYHDYAAIGYKI